MVGAADSQIEAIWIYLSEVDQARLPVGMEENGLFGLIPDARPIIFRCFMQGVGTHAIATGFPESIHTAFDARAVRFAVAWRGAFIDAEGRGRIEGTLSW